MNPHCHFVSLLMHRMKDSGGIAKIFAGILSSVNLKDCLECWGKWGGTRFFQKDGGVVLTDVLERTSPQRAASVTFSLMSKTRAHRHHH